MVVFVIAVVLPKSVHAAYIAENANVYSFNLSENDMALLTSLDQGHKICWSPADVLWWTVCCQLSLPPINPDANTFIELVT